MRAGWWAGRGDSFLSRTSRLLLAVVAGVGTALVAAVALAVADIYLSGHGMRTMSGPFIDVAGLGVHLSAADVLLLGATFIAAGATWRLSGRA